MNILENKQRIMFKIFIFYIKFNDLCNKNHNCFEKIYNTIYVMWSIFLVDNFLKNYRQN